MISRDKATKNFNLDEILLHTVEKNLKKYLFFSVICATFA